MAKEKGDVHGRVDSRTWASACILWVIACRSQGEFAAAQPWFERAVATTEQGDVHGRVDHASLGVSLHQVGYCLSSQGQFVAAQPGSSALSRPRSRVTFTAASITRPWHQPAPGGILPGEPGSVRGGAAWFERAVAAKEQGDIHGRVDHASLGRSLHKVGDCLSSRASSPRRSPGSSAPSRPQRRATSTAASITPASASACTRWVTAWRARASSPRRSPGSSAPFEARRGRRARPRRS